jgi:hypothetical protein
MNLLNVAPPANISNVHPQNSFFNPAAPDIRQPNKYRAKFKELFWDDVMKTQIIIAVIKIAVLWWFDHK